MNEVYIYDSLRLECRMDRDELKHALLNDDTKLMMGTDEEKILLLWELANDTGEPKQARKKAKRALYLLRSKGVDVDSVKPEHREKPSPCDIRKTVETAAFSLPDSGCRSVISVAAVDTKTLSFEAHDFLINTSYGITDHRVRPVGRRAHQRALSEEQFITVPAEYALSRLRRALSLTPDEKRKALAALIDNFTASEAGGTEAEHPVLAFLFPHASRITAPDEEKTLFTEREIQRIALPDESTAEFRPLIEEAKSSRLILDNRTPEQRVSDAISRFCTFYFTGKRRHAFREMLLDVALFYFQQGREGYARILQGYAEGFLNPVRDIRQNPFVQYLTYKAFLMKG